MARRRDQAQLRHRPLDFHEAFAFLVGDVADTPAARATWAEHRERLMTMGAQRPGIRPEAFWLFDSGCPELVAQPGGDHVPGDHADFFAREARRDALWRRRCRWLEAHGQLRPGEGMAIAVEWIRRVEDHRNYVEHLKLRGELPAGFEVDELYREGPP